MNHGVVDAGATRLGLGQHLRYRHFVLAVQVQGQRLGPLVDLCNHLMDIGKAEDGQQRPEDLFFQNPRSGSDVVEQSGLYIALRLVHRTACQHPSAMRLGVVKQGFDARRVPWIDDAGVMFAGLLRRCVCAVGLAQFGLAARQPAFFHALVDKHIVRRDTGLPCVGKLAKHHAGGGQFQIRTGVNNRRAFAAQLQCHAAQMLGRSAHHILTYGGAAGKENMVKRHVQQGLGHIRIALENGYLVGRKQFADQLANHSRQVRR